MDPSVYVFHVPYLVAYAEYWVLLQAFLYDVI